MISPYAICSGLPYLHSHDNLHARQVRRFMVLIQLDAALVRSVVSPSPCHHASHFRHLVRLRLIALVIPKHHSALGQDFPHPTNSTAAIVL